MTSQNPTAPQRQTSERVISLSLTEDYAPSWGVWEGTRELIQNWHDGCLEHGDAGGSVQWEIAHVDDAFSARTGRTLQRYEARHASGRSVGTVVYDPWLQRLTLVNRDVALERRVLLLGTSQKANAADSIGQFGEGMKVGALALLREGRRVEMATRGEHWRWTRREDPAFGVRVLSVEVGPRDEAAATILAAEELEATVEEDAAAAADPAVAAAAAEARRYYRDELRLGEKDTCTLVAPLSPAEWHEFARRFLFLQPPADSYRCELGELLLDQSLTAQLFVKGVWITDLSEQGLGSGLNFKHLRLDRDRRAVLHASDLESQAAAMWVRAIDRRPELAARLYALLDAPSPPSDVRRCAELLQASHPNALALTLTRAGAGARARARSRT